MKKFASYLLIGTLIGFGMVLGATAGASGMSLAQTAFGKIRGNVRNNTDAKIAAINQKIETELGSAFETLNTFQTGRANTEVDKYYNEKISSLATDPAVNDSMNEVVVLTTGLIAEEKARIDAAINAALGK